MHRERGSSQKYKRVFVFIISVSVNHKTKHFLRPPNRLTVFRFLNVMFRTKSFKVKSINSHFSSEEQNNIRYLRVNKRVAS